MAVAAPARARGHRLVEPLAAEEHVEARADDGLAWCRPPRRPHGQIHHEAADDAHPPAPTAHASPRLLPAGWPDGLRARHRDGGPGSRPARNPRATISAIARASPTTAVTAVDVVRHEVPRIGLGLHADVDGGVGQRAQRELPRTRSWPRSPARLGPCTIVTNCAHLGGLPDFEMRQQHVAAATMPASPCRASARGRRTTACPVRRTSTRSLVPTWPDLPSPVDHHAAVGVRSSRPSAGARLGRTRAATACGRAGQCLVGGQERLARQVERHRVASRWQWSGPSTGLRTNDLAGELVDVDLPRVVVALALVPTTRRCWVRMRRHCVGRVGRGHVRRLAVVEGDAAERRSGRRRRARLVGLAEEQVALHVLGLAGARGRRRGGRRR